MATSRNASKQLPMAEPGDPSSRDQAANDMNDTQSGQGPEDVVKATSSDPSGKSATNLSQGNSPKLSRETSPIRPAARSKASSRRSGLNKDSQESSPSRIATPSGQLTSTPSAGAIHRALSSTAATSTQPPNSRSSTSTAKPRKAGTNTPGDGKHHWPVSPRLRSPSPGALSAPGKSPLLSARKPEQTGQASTIVGRRSQTGATSPPTTLSLSAPDTDSEDQAPSSGMRTPIRGVSVGGAILETVQEGSLPSTPAIEMGRAMVSVKDANQESTEPKSDVVAESGAPKAGRRATESGDDSAGNKSDRQKSVSSSKEGATLKPNTVMPLKTYTTIGSRGKTGTEGSAKSMTVETETVSSIPQVAVGGGAGERGNVGRNESGTGLRLKPSSETIRPKKEKKKTARKAPSLNSGTGGSNFSSSHVMWRQRHITSTSFRSEQGSIPRLMNGVSSDETFSGETPSRSGFFSIRPMLSFGSRLTRRNVRVASTKADIFEAKVAIAVDEANGSDSDETFVYSSNPPEPHSTRQGPYHSRTPSTTSVQSQLDQRGMKRTTTGVMDGGHGIAGKRSMKFANNPYTQSPFEGETAERGDGNRTGPLASGRGSNIGNHHHIGNHGRGNRGGHASLFADESPFPKNIHGTPGNTSRHSSRPASPRNGHFLRPHNFNQKKIHGYSTDDIDVEGADDERTPLVSGSARSNRSRNQRRPYNRQLEYDSARRFRTVRIACWSLLAVMVILVVGGGVGFLFATSKPLQDVTVLAIENVLASEQELMMDLCVEGINPNIMAVSIAELDVNVFAKSRYVGTDKLWREHSWEADVAQNRATRKQRHRRGENFPDYDHVGPQADKAIHTSDGVDHGTDPISDPDDLDPQTMLLGQISEFDSPLIFDSSPFAHEAHNVSGAVRLMKPGNKTEDGGTERWERVIQHPFELIVRGVLQYQLPISSRTHKIPIGVRVQVDPKDSLDDKGNMRTFNPLGPHFSKTQISFCKPKKRKEEYDNSDEEAEETTASQGRRRSTPVISV